METIVAVAPDLNTTLAQGELWLKGAATRSYQRVIRVGEASTDHMLVLGPQGSGQGHLLGRLARNAYENGETVVMVCLQQRQGALYHFTQYLDGACREVDADQQAGFNPFLQPKFQAADGLHALHQLLLQLLGQESGRGIEQFQVELFSMLEYYYQQAPWSGVTGPCFTSFFEFVTAPTTRTWAAATWAMDDAALFMAWFASVGRIFCCGEALGDLMNAAPREVAELLHPINRLLYLELCIELADGELAQKRQQYFMWLLLHAIDSHVANGHRPATVLIDELPGCCLQESGEKFLAEYLRPRNRHWRKVIMAWHLSPAALFSPEYPAAINLYESFGYQLLLPAVASEPEPSMLWRSLSQPEKEVLTSLSGADGELFVRGGGAFGKYLVKMDKQELSLYQPAE